MKEKMLTYFILAEFFIGFAWTIDKLARLTVAGVAKLFCYADERHKKRKYTEIPIGESREDF